MLQNKSPKAAVIVFPGTNREKDVHHALTQSGFETSYVWHHDSHLPAVDLVVLPGGFSYGDYLRTGAMAAQSRIMQDVKNHGSRGGRILGICNGFQILCESGLLPGVLQRTDHLKFNCKFVHLRVEAANAPYITNYRPHQVIRVPVAHGDGNYFADKDTLQDLEQNGQIAFRYCNDDGKIAGEGNPNGSQLNIAGIYNKNKTILGLMPHPENAIDAHHGSTDGMAMFTSIFESLAA